MRNSLHSLKCKIVPEKKEIPRRQNEIAVQWLYSKDTPKTNCAAQVKHALKTNCAAQVKHAIGRLKEIAVAEN